MKRHLIVILTILPCIQTTLHAQNITKDTIVYLDNLTDDQITKAIGQFDGKKIKALTLRLEKNVGWVVFSENWGNDYEINFSCQVKVNKLSIEHTKCRTLESLNLSYLGLETLPKLVKHFPNLTMLDISFNYIELEREIDKIIALPHLEKIKVFGCNLTPDVVEKLKNKKPGLTVLYTKSSLVRDTKEKAVKE